MRVAEFAQTFQPSVYAKVHHALTELCVLASKKGRYPDSRAVVAVLRSLFPQEKSLFENDVPCFVRVRKTNIVYWRLRKKRPEDEVPIPKSSDLLWVRRYVTARLI